ncbi:MAG: hypothetical protein CMI60_06750 [Parvibaculum sp.]|nr:hypothetical protein [Parvibaculum sp.]|tara:strand:+ start:8663 stop:8845 length:183 start_codon:yes stop_codon:yes gene_type:complete
MNPDDEQNTRIRTLEQQFNQLSSDVAALTAQITTLSNIGKAIAVLAGAAIGIDFSQMAGA